MKSIVFDAGPIISLTLNGILWMIEPLKEKFKGNFYISEGIKKELVDNPFSTKKFKFSAIKVLHYITNKTLELHHEEKIVELTDKLMKISNNIFFANNNPIKIVHYGEISGIALGIIKKSDAFVVDERTTRLLLENPVRLKSLLKRHLHTEITVNQNNLKEFKEITKGLKAIRSIELVTIAYELGLFDKFFIKKDISEKKDLLESVLWGVKLNGCSVSRREIERIIKLETKE